jgi:tripartite-type tricarboxylate transporter receptor subunit TctC
MKGGNIMARRALVLILSVLFIGSILTQPAAGLEYPTKPVEISCPFGIGSGFDIVIRFYADTLPKYLGQKVVVINRTGAAGSVAAAELIGSKPDGYKLQNTDNIFYALLTKVQKVPFDPYDLSPLVVIMEMKDGIVVRGDSPWRTLDDLLNYGRKNPGKPTWAHIGRGTSEHIVGLQIFKKAGVQATEVAVRSSPERWAALLGGHVDAIFATYGSIKDYIRAGKMRYLVFMSKERYDEPSDVPSLTELGFPELAGLRLLPGISVHKDTPEEIKKILIDAFQKTVNDPMLRKKLQEYGDQPRFGGPDFYMKAIKEAEEVGVPVLKEMGLITK